MEIFKFKLVFFLAKIDFWDFQREKEGKKRVKFQYFQKIPTDPVFLHYMDSRLSLNVNFQVSTLLFRQTWIWGFSMGKRGEKEG